MFQNTKRVEMSKIRIKNFGPIREGYADNGGFIEIKKITTFIGDQGSGKSTIAKVIASMVWLEKALNRGDFKEEPNTSKFFYDLFGYLKLGLTYFEDNTEIEYIGDLYEISYSQADRHTTIKRNTSGEKYLVPKIMYVPAERNFLTVVQNAYNVKGLPPSLFEFAEEFRRSQKELHGAELPLPIKGYKYLYDETKDQSFVVARSHMVNLLEASSGFQSLIPLFVVTNNLANSVKSGSATGDSDLSVDQSIRLANEIGDVISDNSLSEEDKYPKIREIQARYKREVFINIVEEPEQNLYPTPQKEILYELLRFNNMLPGNKLLITTHSPYLINYLTLAVEANSIKEKAIEAGKGIQIDQIVPLASTIKPEDLVIYELSKQGTIKLLENYKGLPSDENLLNEQLSEGNEDFGKLLEIAQHL